MDPSLDSRGSPQLQPQSDSYDHMASTSGRKRVGFTAEVLPGPGLLGPAVQNSDEDTGSAGYNTPLQRTDVSHDDLLEMRESLRLALAEEHSSHVHGSILPPKDVQKPRPAIRKASRTPPQFPINVEPSPSKDVAETGRPSIGTEMKERKGLEAQRRAAKLSKSVGTFSTPSSRRNSQEPQESVPIELQTLSQNYDSAGESTEDENDQDFMKQASMLLRQHTARANLGHSSIGGEDAFHIEAPLRSGQVTPDAFEVEDEHVSRPLKYRTGVLGTLMKVSTANKTPAAPDWHTFHFDRSRATAGGTFSGASTAANSPGSSPPTSGASTPRAGRSWFGRHTNSRSTGSISQLVGSSAHSLATPAQKQLGQEFDEIYRKQRPGMGKRSRSEDSILRLKKSGRRRDEEEMKIKIHLAGTLVRQNYLRKLCKALMMYGAPTHRLEEYLKSTARVLEIDAQFLYMPGCMIIALDDSSVHTSEVKLVRTSQGVDLGKLRDVHEIYKEVIHDRIGVDEAAPRLEAIMSRKDKFHSWFRVFMYGLASATVGPFAFQARFIDLPFCFLLGCTIGWLQLIIAPGNDLISNVFEIGASVFTSFVARALGSIRYHDGTEIFCFSAMAQSSIALILPGFMVLCASLELQSKHIVAGSVRMVYAIIYSLFLGFGITIGTVVYGMMDKNATSNTQCHDPMSTHFHYLFVPAFALCLMVVNQAKYKQMPSMTIIAFIGWVVSFYSSKYFKSNAQVSNTLGALAIGIAANVHARFGRHIENWSLDVWENELRPHMAKVRRVYRKTRRGPLESPSKLERSEYDPTHNGSQPASRASSISEFTPHTRKVGYGLAAAIMLPAIFVQVPSGLSVQGSLISGLTSADQILRNSTGNATTVSPANVGSTSINSIALDVGFSVIQIAIGITVGLFLAALIVYPFGKRRSGLFSF